MPSVFSIFLRGAAWNTGAFVIGQGIRLVTNIVLTRVVTPDLFGTMTIINTITIGAELVSDLGVGQNIISSPQAENPRFYNTVFTFQAIRGALLWLVLCAAALPIATFYKLPELIWLIPISGIVNLLRGFTSPAREFLRKRLQFRELGVFEIIVSALGSATLVALVFISRTIWSLVFGVVLGTLFTVAGSYFLQAGLRLRLRIYREFAPDILHFSKWIFLSSVAYFLSTYYDRLFFAKLVPLQILGIYGIARSIADLFWMLASRLGSGVLFPYVASSLGTPRATLRRELSATRFRFIAFGALGVAALATSSDLVIRVLYDRRYHEATWLLPVLVLGSWFSILANVNESALLGLGKPSYGAISNVVKLLFLLVGLPIGFGFNGLLGATVVVALADVPKILALQIGQRRERFSFASQDATATLLMIALVIAFEATRWSFGFGTSFDTLPPLLPAR